MHGLFTEYLANAWKMDKICGVILQGDSCNKLLNKSSKYNILTVNKLLVTKLLKYIITDI